MKERIQKCTVFLHFNCLYNYYLEILAGRLQQLVVLHAAARFWLLMTEPRTFRDLLGEVVDLTFETSKGRPCLPLPPGLV